MNIQGKKSYLVLMSIVLVAVGLSIAFFYFNKQGNIVSDSQNVDYTIPNVPYVGMHNHVGPLSYATGIFNNDTTAGITSILEYWYPGETNFSEVRHSLVAPSLINGFVGVEDIKALFNQLGNYDVSVMRLKTSDLGKYVNKKVRTPLLLNLPVDAEQSELITFHPMRVIIGVKNSEKKIIVHDYYLGNNYEISFDDLDKMWEKKRPDQRNEYIVIQPKNIDDKLKEIKSRQEVAYAPRTSIMREGEKMLANYVKGLGAYSSGEMDLAMPYFEKVEQDPKFNEYLPNLFRVLTYQRIAQIHLVRENFDKALEYINKSIALNHDLDKPFNDWPGYEIRDNKPDIIDRYSSPLRALGDIYVRLDKLEEARENYQKALDIAPNDSYATNGMKIVETKESLVNQ